MNYKYFTFFALFFTSVITGSMAQLITPEDHFGLKPGSDRNLFLYEDLINYLQKLDKASAKMTMRKIGESPMGKPMYAAFFSNAENIEQLDELRMINKELALNHNLSEKRQAEMIKKGKVFFVATLSMHANEVGPSQAAPLIAHKILSTNDPDTLSWLNDVVYMMIPSHNPDGMNMIVNHYRKYKGTKYEGSSMPKVYHKYVGHDNNRDFVTLTQKDNQAISRIFSNTWFPQVMVEKHQMGSTGPRYFVPPNHDPIAENIDAEIWNWIGVFGMNMIKDMTRKNLAGVSQHYAFDNYWPGSTETCIWKNVIGFLTECASVKSATPVYVEPNELSVWGKGLSEYKKSINMPLPWEGGWWKLSDIMDYEISSTMSIIKTCSNHKEDILKFRNDIAKQEVNKGLTKAPYYFILPGEQHDESEWIDLINLLHRHGIYRYSLTKNIVLQGRNYNKGDVVIPLAQPFRPFIKEVMEKQKYPVRHYTPGGEIIKPYDITSWSLPMHKGVTSIEIDKRSEKLENSLRKIEGLYRPSKKYEDDFYAWFFPFTNNESYKAAFVLKKKGLKVNYFMESSNEKKGGFLIRKQNKNLKEIEQFINELKVKPEILKEKPDHNLHAFTVPEIALVETFLHDMDAGWTRYLFDTYAIPYSVLRPHELKEKDLSEYDAIIFPDNHESIYMKGKYSSDSYYRRNTYPPEYSKGMGKKGKQNLLKYLNDGGKIITWGRSGNLFTGKQVIKDKNDKEEFKLPINDRTKSLKNKGLYCPGSLVEIDIMDKYDYSAGMPDKIGVFYRGRPVYQTETPYFDMDRRVIASFTDENILLSGYSENLELIGGYPAMIWVKKGKGEMVMFTFKPQFRASTPVSYKLIFNSLLFQKK